MLLFKLIGNRRGHAEYDTRIDRFMHDGRLTYTATRLAEVARLSRACLPTSQNRTLSHQVQPLIKPHNIFLGFPCLQANQLHRRDGRFAPDP